MKTALEIVGLSLAVALILFAGVFILGAQLINAALGARNKIDVGPLP
jgi:hypothetical protein